MQNSISIDPSSPPMTADDLLILAKVDSAIEEGQELKEWWAENRETRVRLNRFPIARQIHEPDLNYGFLLEANLRSGALPVAGVIQDQLFSWPKAPVGHPVDPGKIRTQLREFILRHFMRLAAAQPPLRAENLGTNGTGRQSTAEKQSYSGWGYEQVYYKLEKTGQIGKFPESEQTLLVPLDAVGTKYKWVVFKVNIYHFDIPVDLMGAANGPRLTLSMTQPVYAVMSPDFLVDEENPEPGVIGRYGFGYSVVPDPSHKTLFAAGPSQITNTIETLTFRVLETGEVRSHMDFITPQPPRIVNFDAVRWGFAMADRVSFGAASKIFGPVKTLLEGIEPRIDPVYLSVDMINMMTAGTARDEFSVSKQQLFKTLMNLHFSDVYKMFNLAASHFAMVGDWTDTARLPEWARTGIYHPAS